MLNWKQTQAPTILSATLFRYNYVDFRFWNLIKTELNWQYNGSNSILISRRQIKMLIELHYKNELNLIKVSNLENLHEYSDSIYFIWQLITNYPKLQFFIFNLDNNVDYSRIINTTMGPVLRFNYRFIKATIRLIDVWSKETIQRINPLLKRLNLLNDNIPYKQVSAQDLIALLDGFTMGAVYDNDIQINEKISNEILDFLDELDEKFENDNPQILLITDYI